MACIREGEYYSKTLEATGACNLLVLHQYAECKMGGLTWNEHRGKSTWDDSARFWLDGTAPYHNPHYKTEFFQDYQSELQKIGAMKT